MNFLAIGIVFEDGSMWSIGTTDNDPQAVANQLHEANYVIPDEILLVVNGETGPEVEEHYNLGKHYQEE